MTTQWPMVPLGEVLTKSKDWIDLDPSHTYKEVTVRLWGKGVTQRGLVTGSEIAAGKRLRVHANQFIASRIDARNGAFGLIPEFLEGAVVTNDFPVFESNPTRLLPEFLEWFSKTPTFVDLCVASSEGTTNRVRLKEDRFLAAHIPLPPLEEQRRIVARIQALAAKIGEVNLTRKENEDHLHHLLRSAYHKIADNTPRKPLAEVAPLTRRPVTVDVNASYPQVSVRSFGRGSFHKPALTGREITWEKPHLVKAGDILISNIKAWEGAIAAATDLDDGRFGSHRYLTCVPIPNVATAHFVCFHLLTPEGLYEIGEASPGSADRNRTLSSTSLQRIPIPLPSFEKQLWFDNMYRKIDALKKLQAETQRELDALLPSVLDKAFKGEL